MWDEHDGLRIWYDIHGGGVPVLFLHGWTMDHRDEALEYEPIFAKRRGFARIYLDLPGMGQSPSQEWIDCQDRYLDAVLGFLDRVLAGQRFILAGTSAGAYLALGLIHRKADEIDGLLLKVPLVEPDDARRDLPAFRTLIGQPMDSAGNTVEPTDALVHRPGYLDALRRKLSMRVEPAQRMADHERLDVIRRDPKRYAFSFDVASLAQPFDAPTLIVCGRQDTVVGYRDAWSLLELFPRATFAVLDRGDHGLPIDQERPFRALVHDWLDRVEEMRAVRLGP